MSASAAVVPSASVLALAFQFTCAVGLGAAGWLTLLAVARRPQEGDARVQRAWEAVAIAANGICTWAAALCAVSALGAPADVPLGGAVLTLPLHLAVGGAMVLAAARGARRTLRGLWGGLGALSLVAATALWAHAMSWLTPPVAVLGAVAGAGLALLVQVGLLVRLRRRKRNAALAEPLLFASAASLTQALPLTLVALSLPWPAGRAPGLEWVCAAMAAAMAAMVVEAARQERRLAGKGALSASFKAGADAAAAQRTPLADPLTGLLSRLGLETALRKATAEAESQGMRITLLAIGLDGFRSVNDSFGHALGDSVLREVSRRLVQAAGALHEPPKVIGHHLARLGGDEFVLMLQGPVDRQWIVRAAHRLLETVDGPVNCEQHELMLSASIGIACFPEHGGASKLISRANAAMHAAKEAGGSTYMAFEPRMQDDARDRHELLRDLRHAIDNRQLELFYQPKIDARSGQVTGAEALVRWHHPVRGTLAPDMFVPLAERHGLIGALGNWVIDDACRQARVWRQRGLKMRVAINLSVFQMRQPDLVDRIQAALKRHGVNPQRFTCEITESVAMEDTQVTQRTFERLGRAGIHLSIDDFGTGYSSLSYLRRLPATELKIDRSFVMDLETSPDARAIVDAVMKLAHAIGLKVVAEGVENVRQRDILMELGCDEFQGYLFARPMSARALLLWAVDDDASKSAFRPSLFDETDEPSLQAASSTNSVVPLRPRRNVAS